MSRFIRQFHRWISIIFTLTVIANFVAMAMGKPPMLLVYSPLPFLFLLLFTGLYMFFLPYMARGRAAQPAHGAFVREAALRQSSKIS